MLSMDGPTTNWAVFDKLRQHMEGNEMPVLFDIDSCSLHVVYGFFHKKTKKITNFITC